MTHRSARALHAEAGPRIHAPRRGTLRAGSDELLDRQWLRRPEGVRAAAAVLLLQLRDDPLGLLPWSLDRRDPVRNLEWLIGIGGLGPVVLGLLGVHWGWALGLFAACALAAQRLLTGEAHRTALAAREIQTELEHGTPLSALHDQLERLVRDASDLDGARLLLAQSCLERDQPLAALLQLAPLRDRHPGEGAVVLLAALAYAQLGSQMDALRMLEVLAVDPGDAWGEEVARFHECCQRAALGARASSSDIETEF